MNEAQQIVDTAILDHEARLHKKRKKRKKRREYTPEFELFWQRFKGRWNSETSEYDKGSKCEAFIEWQKLTLNERRQAWLFADKVSGKYIVDGCRWLKQKRFEK